MADGTFPTLVSKDRSSNALSNPLYVQLSDGSVALTTVPVSIAGTVTIDANSSDVTVDNGAGASAVNIQDGGNSITVDGSVSITGSVTVTASDLDIRNLNLTDDAVKISANTSANSISNPIYVAVTGAGVSTTEVQDYDTATPGADSTSNHDYTVTGSTFLLRSVIFSASGGLKVEIQGGPLASLVTYAVGFIARQGGTEQVTFEPPIEVPVTSTGTVRVIRTNRQGAAMDVYTTIIGDDLP
jgi:hypothetical protein